MKANELPRAEYADHYAGYVAQIPPISLLSALDESAAELLDYLTHLPEDQVDYRYAPGKWTVKECLQHVIDAERVFQSRALRVGRGDVTPIPGYEQDDYAAMADLSQRRWRDMIEEFRVVRRSTTWLFKSFTPADLERMGTMSDSAVSCRAIGFIISGHALHHARLYRERYHAVAAV